MSELTAYRDLLGESARQHGAGPVLPDEIKEAYVDQDDGEVIFDVLSHLFHAAVGVAAEERQPFDDRSFKFAATLALEQLGFRR